MFAYLQVKVFEPNSTFLFYLLDPRFLAPHWQVKVISVAAPFLVIHLLQTLCLNLTVIVSRWARRHLDKINTRQNSGFLLMAWAMHTLPDFFFILSVVDR